MSVSVERLLTLPSVHRFLDLVRRDLREGRSVLVGLPRGTRADLVRDALLDALRRDDLRVQIIDVVDHVVPQDADGLFRAVLGWSDDSSSSITEILGRWDCPDVLLLDRLDRVSENHQQAWTCRVMEWAERVKTLEIPADRSPSVCLVGPGSLLSQAPGSRGVRLSVRYWWGFPSSLELRLLFREDTTETNALAAWRECLVAGVAAGDLGLVEHLSASDPRSVTDLAACLVGYAATSGMTVSTRARDPDDGRRPARIAGGIVPDPVPALRDLWACGNIVASSDFGPELHPAVLAYRGSHRALEHRLWRGQAPLILPLIDHLRLGFCTQLQRWLGEHWFTSFPRPADPNDDRRLQEEPLAAELGYLVSVILPGLQKRGIGAPLREWGGPLDSAWRARNALAHYRPMGLSEFRALWAELGGVDSE